MHLETSPASTEMSVFDQRGRGVRGPIVFVAGCGRSGTSFLRTVLDAHPEIYIPSESLFLSDYLRYEASVPKRVLQFLFFREPQLRCWYDGPRFQFNDAAEAIDRVHGHMARRSGARIWGEKTPRFIRDWQLFSRRLPDIKWVVVYRDPRAVVSSMLGSGQHTSSIWHACERWNRDNRALVALKESDLAATNVLIVCYEDLVREFDAHMSRIFDFLGARPIDRDVIEKNAKPVFFSRSRFRINTVRDGILPDEAKLADWKEKLSDQQVRRIEEHCWDMMLKLGYVPERAKGPATSKPRPLERLKDIGVIGRYMWYWPEYPIHHLLRRAVFQAFQSIGWRRRSA
ncbi:sulfotransferase [Ectothiorhodospiraceae bacterium WFHF3C12]|nr:sulfotransferase [Ectothiorhodospiraceae bacterium WFHF3C12]